MASNPSSRDLAKAIAAFIDEPTLPIPSDLADEISAYLQRHPKYDETAADRLQEELLSIFDKHVKGNFSLLGPWASILRRLMPMIKTPERIIMWLDCLKGYLTSQTENNKGVVNETLAAVMDLVALADEYQEVSGDDEPTNPIIHRLFSTWMERVYPAFVDGVPGVEYNERMFREALVHFGQKRPLQFFASLDSFFAQSMHRRAALRFLCDFLQNRPPHVHDILAGPLFTHLLTCLQEDTSTAVVSSALTALVMLLPQMPSSLVPHLPVLFNIYARLLFWKGRKQPETTEDTSTHESEMANGWDVCADEPGDDDATIAHLASYYTILYGLYPINFMDYIRKPQRYLRHANVANANEFEIQPTDLRHHSEKFARRHLLHPNFYNLTVETEKTDFTRWVKSEASEVVADCMALCLSPDSPAGPHWDPAAVPVPLIPPVAVGPPKDGPDVSLLSRSPPADTGMTRIKSSSSFRTMTRHESHSTATSNRDLSEPRGHNSIPEGSEGQGLVHSPSNSQLQDLIQSNREIKSSSLKQAAGDESEASPIIKGQDPVTRDPMSSSIPHETFFNAPMTLTDGDSTLTHLQRQNLMLQNDLSFERYQKQQHIAHISELRRKQMGEAATEAETQNLIIMNRNLKNRFEEAKKAEIQVRKESEKSRSLAKKWEADLSSKLKNLRDHSKELKAELDQAKRELGDAQDERRKLRKLVCAEEVKELNLKQNIQSAELQRSEMGRLEAEVARLRKLESEMHARQRERNEAVAAAAAAESRVEGLHARLAAHEVELQRARKLFEEQVQELQAKLSETRPRGEAVQDAGNAPKANGHRQDLEKLMAGSRAKQADMQKQYDMLMRKYTALQSSLLDMQSGATPEQIKLESPSVPLVGKESNSAGRPATSAGAGSEVADPSRPRTRVSELSGAGVGVPGATSYNVTPPLREQYDYGVAAGAGQQQQQRPGTPSNGADAAGGPPMSPEQRYHGRGGVQNRTRKEGKGKQKDEEGAPSVLSGSGKKEKKTGGLRGIRTGVGEFVRGRTE